MAYTPPINGSIDFVMTSSYTPPANGSIDFVMEEGAGPEPDPTPILLIANGLGGNTLGGNCSLMG